MFVVKTVEQIKNMQVIIESVNKMIDLWIDQLSKYAYEQLCLKPGPENWSLGQVYMHLIEDTRWYYQQIEQCLLNPDHATEETSKTAKNIFAANDLGNVQITGDPFAAESMAQPERIAQLKADMQALKTEANDLWKMVVVADEMGKSKHPCLGYLDPYEWFRHTEIHMRHHLKQKARIDDFLKR